MRDTEPYLSTDRASQEATIDLRHERDQSIRAGVARIDFPLRNKIRSYRDTKMNIVDQTNQPVTGMPSSDLNFDYRTNRNSRLWDMYWLHCLFDPLARDL